MPLPCRFRVGAQKPNDGRRQLKDLGYEGKFGLLFVKYRAMPKEAHTRWERKKWVAGLVGAF